MSETMLHPKPRWSTVAREQFRAVGLATRREWLLFGLGLVGLTVLFAVLYAQARAEGGRFNFEFTPGIAAPLVFLGIMAPFSVWKGMEPSRRGYLWALPADRGGHTLLRNFEGWLWFMALVALYLLWGWGMAWITGGDIGVSEQPVFLGHWDGPGQPDPEGFQRLRVFVSGWQWAVPFVAATATYLLGSAVVLASDHAWRWLAGIAVGFFLLVAVSEAADLDALQAALNAVFEGRWGLETLLLGTRWVEEQFTTQAGKMVTGSVARPALSAWLGAAALWLGLGTAGTLAAALRHQER